MIGISEISVQDLKDKVARFRRAYADDWITWLATPAVDRPRQLKLILGRWQACRSNSVREACPSATSFHGPPYLHDLIVAAQSHIAVLQNFDMHCGGCFTFSECQSIKSLWKIFEDISYAKVKPNRKRQPPRGGLAGVVGISKATMLLTEGRVGPAFDSKVRKNLSLSDIRDADDWLHALRLASRDIKHFEVRNATTLQIASGLTNFRTGRIYDMALGPG